MNLSLCYIMFLILLTISLLLLSMGGMIISVDQAFLIEYEIVTVNSSNVIMTFLFDWMSLTFSGFVMFISALVMLYSESYMSGDKNMSRFIIMVFLFVVSMMFLIFSPNLISILLGWDGLGLVSYCLVIYYQNPKSYNAGMITALSNRVGDVALLMSIAWMLNYGSWNFIYYLDRMTNDFSMVFIMSMVVLAAMTSSAQIPFSSWLPAAMAAPTPVSALVHSSTLVTAGVYLMIRFNKMLESMNISNILLIIASLTMFMAGMGAMYEYDLKKIIALSTLSQLGLMMAILSLGLPMLAFFHLLTHAFFKALLFLCAGSLIHSVKDYQDIRFMGSMSNGMPFTCSCLNISNLSLCGFPFLSGFYSKDLILESSLQVWGNFITVSLFYISTMLTAAYSFRLSYYLMMNTYLNNSLSSFDDKSDEMCLSMMMMIILAVIGGSMLNWLLFPIPFSINLPTYMKVMALMVSVLGVWMGLESSLGEYLKMKMGGVKNFFLNFLGTMWFMPVLSTAGVNPPVLSAGGSVFKIDKSWSEFYGGQGVYYLFMLISKKISMPSMMGVKSYLTLFFFFILLMYMMFFIL